LRFYTPSLGRFINRDPSEEVGGANLFVFCGNNGVNRWDKLGTWWLDKKGELMPSNAAEGFEKWTQNHAMPGYFNAPTPDPSASPSWDPLGWWQGQVDAQPYIDPYTHLNVTGSVASGGVTISDDHDNIVHQWARDEETGEWIDVADPNSASLANGPGIDANKFKPISSIKDVADPRAQALLRFIANDPKANRLAQSATANTGFANAADRQNGRLTEYGTLQALALVNGKVTPVLYPTLFDSGQGSWSGGFNSIAALDGNNLAGYAQEMGISGQIYWANFHDHGGTGPLSGGDAGWAQTNGGMTVVRDRNTLYIATGVLSASGPITLLYKAPISLLNFQ